MSTTRKVIDPNAVGPRVLHLLVEKRFDGFFEYPEYYDGSTGRVLPFDTMVDLIKRGRLYLPVNESEGK